jgi:membrane protein DedA with SNARE-associated domain/rhodanese-related sulfurtransferase
MQHVMWLVQHHGLLIVLGTVLLNGAGIPIPSYPILMMAGALMLTDGPSPLVILLTAAVAAMFADLGWYLAGAHFGRRIPAFLCKLSLSPDSCVRQTETVYIRAGPLALLFARFVPGLGNIAVVLSGILGVGLPLFLLLDALGAALYFTVPIILGRLFHDTIDSLLLTLTRLGQYGLMLVAVALAIYLLGRWIRRRLFIRQLRMDRISVSELAVLIDRGESPVIFDVRTAEARLRDGIIPGSLAAHHSDIATALEAYPHEIEVVVYCSCPNEASAATAARHLKRAGFKKIRPLLGGIEAWSQAGRAIEIPN